MTTRTKCHTATRTVLLLAGLLALAAAGPAPVPVYKEFGDWVAACDNVRTCTAHATPDGNSDAADAQNGITLTVTRDAGGAAMPSVAVAGEHPGIPTAVSIDGHPVTGAAAMGHRGNGRQQGCDVIRRTSPGVTATHAGWLRHGLVAARQQRPDFARGPGCHAAAVRRCAGPARHHCRVGPAWPAGGRVRAACPGRARRACRRRAAAAGKMARRWRP